MLIRRKLIKTKAAEILERWGNQQPPVDVRRIAESYKIIINSNNAPEGDLAGFLVVQGEIKIIGIHSEHSAHRQNFTIAHELGHFFLHVNLTNPNSSHIDKQSTTSSTYFRDAKSSQGVDPLEIEANLFAAELLMPEKAIIETLKDSSSLLNCCGEDTIGALSKKFGVSVQAMTLRLINLGLLIM